MSYALQGPWKDLTTFKGEFNLTAQISGSVFILMYVKLFFFEVVGPLIVLAVYAYFVPQGVRGGSATLFL
ncbi:MAG: hypothetical protein WDZ28_03310 [Simkaniaceae bacterium]